MPVSSSHDLSNATDAVGWNVFVKEVAHRVDEDLPRASPVQRLLKLLGHQSQVEPLLEGVPRHAAETLREHLRVAELAARTHLDAASHRIPSCVRPLDGRAITHGRLVYARSMTGQVTVMERRSRCLWNVKRRRIHQDRQQTVAPRYQTGEEIHRGDRVTVGVEPLVRSCARHGDNGATAVT